MINTLLDSSVLIVTRKLDPHSDAVIDELHKLGETTFRLNSDDFLDDYLLTFSCNQEQGASAEMTDHIGRHVSLNSIKSAYYRKPGPLKVHSYSDVGVSNFVKEETQAAINIIYSFPGIKWLNNPLSIRAANNKIAQLHLAVVLGLFTPRTIVTTKRDDLIRFVRETRGSFLCKPINTVTVSREGSNYQAFARRIKSENLLIEADAVTTCPVIIQEYIEKDYELRVIVLDTEVFAFRIESQSDERTLDDWRAKSPFEIHHRVEKIPEDLKGKLVLLISHFGLRFGAIDLIKKINGDYVFLENNSNGQWYWLEMITGVPLAKCVAQLLSGKNIKLT